MSSVNETYDIEQKLGSLLGPVSPQEGFVGELQDRLRKKAAIAIEKPDYLVLILLVMSGLVFGIILFWLFKMLFRLLAYGKR